MLEKGPPLTRENCRVIRCRQEDKPCATNRLPIGFRDVHLQKQSRFYRRRVLETRPTQTSQDVRSALISGISSADDVVRSQVTGSKSLALNLKIGTWVIRDDDLPLFRALSPTGAAIALTLAHRNALVETLRRMLASSRTTSRPSARNMDKPARRPNPPANLTGESDAWHGLRFSGPCLDPVRLNRLERVRHPDLQFLIY